MKRSELFTLVWSEPVVKIARRLGISDRGLAKICTRHNIPLPPRGYWARVKSGQHPAALALPRPDHDYEIAIKASDDGASAPVLDLQDAMDMLFRRNTRPAPSPAAEGHSTPELHSAQTTTAPVATHQRALPIGTATMTDPTGQLGWRNALDSECERAMAAGMEYQRRQAAQAFLTAVVTCAYTLDEPTSELVLDWARAVHKKLSQVDPVRAIINELKA